jgi:hypothetical protein
LTNFCDPLGNVLENHAISGMVSRREKPCDPTDISITADIIHRLLLYDYRNECNNENFGAHNNIDRQFLNSWMEANKGVMKA